MSDVEEVFRPCTVCGRLTSWCCVDCGIDLADKLENVPHVCERTTCRDEHERAVHGGVS